MNKPCIIGERWIIKHESGTALAEVYRHGSMIYAYMKILEILTIKFGWKVGDIMNETQPLNHYWTLLPNQNIQKEIV